MLKKRFIGVITVRNGWVVQSFGYRRYLPIGRLAVVVENLDRWGVDEIMVLAIDRSAKDLGPDVELLNTLSALSISTPLTYGGGIRNVEQALLVVQAGAERVCLDTALHGDPGALREISTHIGSQAVVASLPLSIEAGRILWYDHLARKQSSPDKAINRIFDDGLVSEALVIDWKHEGMRNGFEMDLLQRFPVAGIPLIAFGGLSEPAQIKRVLKMPQVAAVGVGNFLNYTEHSVQRYKDSLRLNILRPAQYLERKV